MSDERIIAGQIGRTPRGLLAIGRRCVHGYPQVVVVRPIVDRAPFPTLYWLTCPHLRTAIDRLEADGWIGRLERRIASDDRLAAAFAAARQRYVAERLRVLTDAERRSLEAAGRMAALTERGIGGTRDPRRVKCLHAQAAHALVGENPIGAMVLEMLPAVECPLQNAICSARESSGADRPRISR